jgi:hypothetical protein
VALFAKLVRHRPLSVVVLSIALVACTQAEATFDTYTEAGVEWIATDCPQADQALAGGSGDGLPMKGQTDRDRVEAFVAENYVDASVVPRNGEVWDRADDGSVVLERVSDFMLQVTIDSVSDCPSAPMSSNGIPIVYVISEAE